MKTHDVLLAGRASLLGLSLLFAGCSGGGGLSSGSSAGGGAMFIEACSLGCGNGGSGEQISCSIVNVGQNSEITFLFSEMVDPQSVNMGSIRVVNTMDGTVPGYYAVPDPNNNKLLIFRPTLTWDTLGNPEFGFDANQTYEITIPGLVQGDSGPFIQSYGGKQNTTRIQCTIRTTEGLIDPIPGPPTAVVYVTLEDGTTMPIPEGILDPEEYEVACDSKITVEFLDVMNRATIANLETGESSTILVMVDTDGDLSTPGDQVVQSGTWQVSEGSHASITLAVFTPAGGSFPAAGPSMEEGRLTVVTLLDALRDLVGNPLANPGEYAFQTGLQDFPYITLPDAEGPDDEPGEDFSSTVNRDNSNTGAEWGNGMLTWGIGGGSGRLGELVVPAGKTIVLNTDGHTFPLTLDDDGVKQVRSLLDNNDPGEPGTGAGGDYDPTNPDTWSTITVTDGNFEFSSVDVEANAVLVIAGSQAGRVFARGELVNSGIIDLTGMMAPAHISNTGGDHYQGQNGDHWMESLEGGAGGTGGPAAGAGGKGADRLDSTHPSFGALMKNMGGVYNPGAVNDGAKGQGVGGNTSTGGRGGAHYPPTLPSHPGLSNSAFGDAEISILDPADAHHQNPKECTVGMVAGPGSGGAYALDGGVGMPHSDFLPTWPDALPNLPDETPGGDNSSLRLERPGSIGGVLPPTRHLDWVHGNLRGGAGGGGGGTSIYGSKPNSSSSPACDAGSGGTSMLFPFFDHSAAGGGGGGGAVQLVAGSKMSIFGTIDCSGGGGGSATGDNIPLQNKCMYSGSDAATYAPDCEEYASPGGGGSGGAIKLQSRIIEYASSPARFIVNGGDGGFGAGGSLGGIGSPGLVRIEHSGYQNDAADAAQFAPLTSPYYPDDTTGFNDPFLSAAILSLGDWGEQLYRPASYSGAQSCWMKPEVTDLPSVGSCSKFFDLAFVDDTDGSTDPAEMGWNMKVVYNAPGGVEKYWYRGDDPASPVSPSDFETYIGSSFNHDELSPSDGSLFAVRFQGASAKGNINDLCNVDLGPGQNIELGSLTPWVRHPADLNHFVPRPNMVRFTIVFEKRLLEQDPIWGQIIGITDLAIEVKPN